MTDEQWQLVLRYWPDAQKRALKTAAYLRKRKLPVDEDQMEADALDVIIDAVRNLTDEAKMEERLKFLHHPLATKDDHRRRQRRKETYYEDEYRLGGKDHSFVDSVEDFLQQYPKLPTKWRNLLLKVAYKRTEPNTDGSAETLGDLLKPKELRMWEQKVRPALKKWAIQNQIAEVTE